ncbi:ankyrin [Penicillium robsamsonii]|uniref:ankyrin n=1 Tax=Penicillium robsamsonii TaxID=1792511 RepID=UPI002548DBB0|nr:ankyrin [Penicillium robsamsonii]KAJ5837090.1 ankyrin [Penicillium robsamsonii]
MRVPLEILELILKEAVQSLSYQDILRSRLINSLFNDVLWPASAHLENKKSLFTSWHKFPYKRKYLWYLIEEHCTRPCIFSYLIQDILALPRVACMSVQGQHTIIDKMIDAIIHSVYDPEALYGLHRPGHLKPMAKLHYPSSSLRFEGYGAFLVPSRQSQESTETTLDEALIASAIYRGDHVELQALLDRRNCSGLWDQNLGLVPVDLAYKEGTREVIRTLVEHGCVTMYTGKSAWHYESTCGLAVAARRGDKEVLETWVTLLSERAARREQSLSCELRTAVLGALRIGKFEMVAVLEKHIDWTRSDMKLLWFQSFYQAVENGMLDSLQWLLSREGSSLARQTTEWHKTPLFIALQDCPVEKRLAMVGLLLGHGADPDGGEVSRTPLHRAIENGEEEIAMLLLNAGADPNVVGRRGPPLHMATKWGYPRLVRCLLKHNARRNYQFKGMEYVVYQDSRVVGNIMRLLGELGLEEEPVQGEYYVLGQKCTR